MSAYATRPATPEDEPYLREILYQAIFVPAGHEPPPREIVRAPEFARYIDGWGRPGDAGVIALESTTWSRVGAAFLRLFPRESPGYGLVDAETPELAIAVEGAHRGRGVGTVLMEALMDAAAEQYEAVSLSVHKDNPALRLYQRLGFEVVSESGASYTMRRWLHR